MAKNNLKIFLGADHRGFKLKEEIKKYLLEEGIDFEDMGNEAYDANDDFPDFAFLVSEKVALSAENRGVLICGSGVGMCITANKFKGIRAGQAYDAKRAEKIRKEDDVNILCLEADSLNKESAFKIINSFLETDFLGLEKYKRRIEKIARM